MSAKMIKDGNEYKLGVIPQNVIDDVLELKAKTTWKLLGTTTGTSTSMSFPSEFEELIINVIIPYTSYNVGVSLHLSKVQLTETAFYDIGSINTFVRIYVECTNKYLILNYAETENVDFSASSVMSVYYR
jgi:hypothetical protein